MKKKVIIAILIFLIVLLVVGFFIFKKQSIEGKDLVAYTSLRLAKSEVTLGKSPSSFDEMQMSILGNFVKKINSSNQWFARNSGTFYVGDADTSDMQVTWISDGTYTAKFYVRRKKAKYILEKYTFSMETEKGYELLVE